MDSIQRHKVALAFLRFVGAGTMIIHGATRILLGGVDDFGVFLGNTGLPAGAVLAWAVTLGELAGGVLLAADRWTRVIASWFAVELILGVILVHAPDGWFVVGFGRNGMEYSAVLIALFLAVAFAAGKDIDSD